jgi:uncharacterized membrane protein YbhN (UPF0104 family)
MNEINEKNRKIEAAKSKMTNGNASPKEKRKKRYLNLALIIFNVFVLFLVFLNAMDEKSVSLLEAFSRVRFNYLLLAVSMYLIAMLTETVMNYYLIKISTGKRRPMLSLKAGIIEKYYDNVTPLALGGQPFQMVYYNQNEIPGHIATSLPLIKYFCFSIVYLLFSLFVFIFRSSVLNTLPPATAIIIKTVAWIGLFFNLALPLFLVLGSTLKRFANKLTVFILRAGKRLHIVKDYDKTYLRAQKTVSEFQASMKHISGNYFSIVFLTVFNLIKFVATISTPYFAILTFSGLPFSTVEWVTVSFMFVFCLNAVSFIPIPGTAGASELTFDLVFGVMLTGSLLSLSIVLWRVISFYSYVVVGLVMVVSGQFKHKKKNNGIRSNVETPEAGIVKAADGNARDTGAEVEKSMETAANAVGAGFNRSLETGAGALSEFARDGGIGGDFEGDNADAVSIDGIFEAGGTDRAVAEGGVKRAASKDGVKSAAAKKAAAKRVANKPVAGKGTANNDASKGSVVRRTANKVAPNGKTKNANGNDI